MYTNLFDLYFNAEFFFFFKLKKWENLIFYVGYVVHWSVQYYTTNTAAQLCDIKINEFMEELKKLIFLIFKLIKCKF